MFDRRSHDLASALLAATLVATGCGGADPAGEGSSGHAGSSGGSSTGGGGPSTGAPLDPQALCAEIIALQCQGHMSCCDREDDMYASAQECASLLEPLCVQDLSGIAYSSGSIAFDRAAYDRAVGLLRTAVESCEPVGRDIFDAVFTGTVAEGGDCTPAVEQGDYSSLLACGSGLACIVREGSEQRVCAPAAGEGDSCLDVDCGAGLFCGGGNQPVCRQLRADGIGCTAHSECESGFCGDDERCGALTVTYRYCADLTYP